MKRICEGEGKGKLREIVEVREQEKRKINMDESVKVRERMKAREQEE